MDLLHPAGTIMDLNIGAALWLAAGGEGTLRLPPHRSTQHESQHRERDGRGCESRAADGLRDDAWESPGAPNQGLLEGQAYRSGARVVMLGHGADEQCAGYGRHRTRWGVMWLDPFGGLIAVRTSARDAGVCGWALPQ